MTNNTKQFLLLIFGLSLITSNIFAMNTSDDDDTIEEVDFGFFKFKPVDRTKKNLAALEAEMGKHPKGSAAYLKAQAEHKLLEDEYRKTQSRLDNLQTKIDDIAIGIAGDYFKDQATLQSKLKLEQQRGLIDNMGQMARLKEIISNLKDPQNMQLALLFLLGATVVTVGGYYTIAITARQLEKYLNKPKFIRESSLGGISEGIRTLIYTMIHGDLPQPDLADMVFEPELESIAHKLVSDIALIKQYGLKYEKAIFHGPPGTGKTEFAKMLAQLSGLHYAICSAADIKEPEQIQELYDWAETSKGMIIFIDEIDVLLADRSKMTDLKKLDLINKWLSLTGSTSDKVMTIIATNFLSRLDSAARSRFSLELEFTLPGLTERIRMLKQKINKELAHDIRSYSHEGETVTVHLTIDPSINDDYIASIAQQMEHFSGRDIEQFIQSVKTAAYKTGKNIVTPEVINPLLRRKIAKVAKDKTIAKMQNSDDTEKIHRALIA